jgi:Oxidoreductase molybdopterin binding domain
MYLSKFLPGFVSTVVALCQQPAVISLQGLEGKPVTVTTEDLAKLPQHSIKASEHGSSATFEGVLLNDVLTLVNVPIGEKLRGKALTQYLLVEAADGYRIVFALPELDPAFTSQRVYLVTKRDGKPLSEKEGAFRIVVPAEKRPARWVRQVTALKIKQAE